MKFGEVIYIEWVDSTSDYQGWHEPLKEKVVALQPIHTIGFYLYETEDAVVTTHSVSEEHAFNTFSIPKGTIKTMEVINAKQE